MGVKEFDDKSNLAASRSDRSSSSLLNSIFVLLNKFSDRCHPSFATSPTVDLTTHL
ncbi:MAG: hypothetical protein RMY64_12895 [Nostoc sp. DedQUE08]|uniref:hypothetical protein n=1 Tax=unclassified Nostoc TaxID=2593658 RepID=UPI002AD57E02|nr:MULTISPECIES: hypothetical protein [unclassified Nostoc]MDZ8066493.1 hypothetical protein [Nostoc sp. DedQUE08]MDZ8092788.1 hypothetical protein [Nostoc sp. DedQUE05]